MTTQRNISFHEGQNWKIDFTAYKSDGTVLPLVSGTDVRFILSSLSPLGDEVVKVLDYTTADFIEITDGPSGKAAINIPVSEQTDNGITANNIYYYEISAYNGTWLVQAEGRLSVERSLSSTLVNPLLLQFQLRFPEFTEDDNVLLIYLADAARVVADANFQEKDQATATVYLAAHLLQMRKIAIQRSESGGVETGEIKSISVEDRTVTFATGSTSNNSQAKTGINQTPYGQQYLAMLRRVPQFIMRA